MAKSRSVVMETNVPIRMRDGVRLYADVLRPAGAGKVPVVIGRTPYAKENLSNSLVHPLAALKHGYAYVVQDCRGCFSSEGDLYPFHQEQNDGYDTVEWVARQPWCDGNVAVIGASYLGCTVWQAALARPPHLKAIVPAITASDYREHWVYQGGALLLDFAPGWGFRLQVPRLLPLGLKGKEAAALGLMLGSEWDPEAILACFAGKPAWLKRERIPYIFDWLDHQDDDDYWAPVRVAAQAPRVTVPAFNIGGWYDGFQEGATENFKAMLAKADSPGARAGQQLLIGPWAHASLLSPGGRGIGQVDFGIFATYGGAQIEERIFRFLDTHLRGAMPGGDAPVRLFVMGANVWRDEREWPLKRAVPTEFFLSGGGRANTASGNGRLERVRPSGAGSDSYVYDPRHPTPTLGSMLIYNGGPYDQRAVEQRADVLCYTSGPLEKDVEVTGAVELALWGTSTAPTIDWTGKLVDVYPDGFARNITDGILRLKELTPGKTALYRIKLGVTSHRFAKGHRIRLEVASANYPRFDRNPLNSKRLLDVSSRPATQTVLHDRARPSRLILPIVED